MHKLEVNIQTPYLFTFLEVLICFRTGILQEAIDLAVSLRGKPQPKPKDFEFLMRKNVVKVLRLKKYLKDLQFFKKHVRSMLGERYIFYKQFHF